MRRQFVVLMAAAAFASAQTHVVKDRNGVPIVAISDIEMFRCSEHLQKRVPEFRATVKNVFGRSWNVASRDLLLNVTVHKKDGSRTTFPVSIDLGFDGFPKDSTRDVGRSFTEPFRYTEDNFSSVAFAFSSSWKSPEDERRAMADRTRRMTDDRAKLAAERARMRDACMRIYIDTGGARLGDLTIAQAQQVRRCEALGLYPPGAADRR